MATYRMNHWYSDEWCRDHHARTQEVLQTMAKSIRANCEVVEISPVNGQSDTANICTILENKALGLKYWIKDTLGHIDEIDEARAY